MMKREITILFAMLIFGSASASAPAINYLFDPEVGNSGLWSSEDDWFPTGIPVDGDKATIPDGKTCYVTDYTAACDNFVVEDGGKLVIDDDGTLTTDGPADNDVDAALFVYGTLTMDNDMYVGPGDPHGVVRMFVDEGVYTSEINGQGKIIIGVAPYSYLEGAGILKVDIENNGEAGAWGPLGGGSPPCEGPLTLEGELSGSGTWRAIDSLASSAGGELIVDTAVSAFTGLWQTYTGAPNWIVFKKEVTGSADFIVDGLGGLQIEDDFCTVGDLKLGASLGEPTIKVRKGKVARFADPNGCNGIAREGTPV